MYAEAQGLLEVNSSIILDLVDSNQFISSFMSSAYVILLKFVLYPLLSQLVGKDVGVKKDFIVKYPLEAWF